MLRLITWPPMYAQVALKLLRGTILNIPGLRNVRDIDDKPDCRHVLFDETVKDAGTRLLDRSVGHFTVTAFLSSPRPRCAELTQLREEVRKDIAARGWTPKAFTARLEYANFGADQVLKVPAATRSSAELSVPTPAPPMRARQLDHHAHDMLFTM